jgi:MoaA/NifB/PqqE/SkfB family radical SAM enzyme
MIDLRRQVMLSDDGAISSGNGRLAYDPVSNATTTVATLDGLDSRSAPRDAHTAALCYYFAAPGGAASPALNWELTYACTWRCRHCFQPTVHVRPPRALEADDKRSGCVETVAEDTIDRVIDLLRGQKACEVSLTGGEVLLVGNLSTIVYRLREALPDLSVRVLLSGCNLPQRAAAMGLLSALADAQACARVPLYGPTPEVHDWVTRVPGSFDDIVGFVDLAREAGVRVHVGVQVLRETYPYLATTLQLAQELTDGDFSLSTIIYPALRGDGFDHGVSADQLMHLLRSSLTAAVATDYLSFEHRQCDSGCRYPTVDPVGRLRSCDIAGVPVGRLRDATESLRTELRPSSIKLAGDCLECTYASACKRCPTFLRDDRCRPGHGARVAAATLVVARRAEAARRLGYRFVDDTVAAALVPQAQESSQGVTDVGH